MGVIISRFRKKSAPEQLENIEEEIKELEACSADSKLRHQKITKQLLIYSSGLCIIFAVLLYFYIPSKLQTKIILIMLLLLSPLIYFTVNKIITWYYIRKIASSHRKLKDLKAKKKRLIDEIMNKETYKVAKEILEKYAPETLPPKYPARSGSGGLAPSISTAAVVQRSSLGVPGIFAVTQQPPDKQANGQSVNTRALNLTRQGQQAAGMGQMLQPFNFSKGYVERVLEYLIGDGPNNRYALICKNCSTHNGMTLQEEFEYTAFKCYACFMLNPARKQRPIGPKLDVDRSVRDTPELDSCSSSASGEQDLNAEEIEDKDKEDEIEGEFYGRRTVENVREISTTPDFQDTENNGFGGETSSSTLYLRESRSFERNSEGEEDASARMPSEETFEILRPSTTADDLNDRLVKSDTEMNEVDSGTKEGEE